MGKSCLVIGGDGYMGWPLVLDLAFKKEISKIYILDNFLTRKNVKIVKSNSIVKIDSLKTRVKKLNSILKIKKVYLTIGSTLEKKKLDNLIKMKFNYIYHLGHQRTAPYSMLDQKRCIETIKNNEIGFLNLIWSLKNYSKNTLLIKLGSFGAYALSGIKIPEDDQIITIKGKKLKTKTPFPKMALDFYHITKANDALFARAACINWGLKIIDVQQSTVFGVMTEFISLTKLYTRLDYDEIFGTVVNRFICQAIANRPMTVYGGGNHSTGIMCLEDAIKFLSFIRKLKLKKGQYKNLNSNPYAFKIKELAKMTKKQLMKVGVKSKLTDKYDPRYEKKGLKFVNSAECNLLKRNIKISKVETEISETIKLVLKFKKNINIKVLNPSHKW